MDTKTRALQFAQALNAALATRRMRQVDLVLKAKEHGVKLGKSQVSQYLSGKSLPRREVIAALEEILGASLTSASAVAATTTHASVSAVQAPAAPATVASTTVAPLAHASAPSLAHTLESSARPRRIFKKSSKLENVLYDVRGPVVDEAARMEANGEHVLKLNIGNPAPFGFRAPDEVVLDMRQQLTDCEGYSASRGLFSCRKAIMQYDQLRHIPNVTMNDIYTGNGVSELINLSMQALLDSGDEILIPSPDYPLWTACATLAGGTPVHYLCDEQAHWYPDIDDMRSKITPRTKAIVVINPNNPTGVLYSKEVLEDIVSLAREFGLMIFCDEIYDRLVMDEKKHISIASLAPDLFCVTFSGLSKSHMIAGYRIGWMTLSGNKALAKDYIMGINMLSNMRLCSNVPAQSIVQTALGGYQSVENYLVPGGRVYEQREFCFDALQQMEGVSVVKPDAAFYMFVHLDHKKFNITDDEQFALDLLRDKKVLIVHGKGFNWETPGYFRIVYLPRLQTLRDAMSHLATFLETYHQ